MRRQRQAKRKAGNRKQGPGTQPLNGTQLVLAGATWLPSSSPILLESPAVAVCIKRILRTCFGVGASARKPEPPAGRTATTCMACKSASVAGVWLCFLLASDDAAIVQRAQTTASWVLMYAAQCSARRTVGLECASAVCRNGRHRELCCG